MDAIDIDITKMGTHGMGIAEQPSAVAQETLLIEKPYYSPKEASKRIGVSIRHFKRWLAQGLIASSRLGHRTVRISHKNLEKFMEARCR